MKPLLRNESGFSIVQTSLVALVVLGLAFYAASSTVGQGKRSKMRRQNSKYQALVDHLQKQLNDPVLCTAALSGQAIAISPPGANPPPWSDVRLNLSYGSTPGPIRGGWESKADDYRLRALQMVATEPSRYTRYDGSTAQRTLIYDWPNLGPTPNGFLKYKASIRIVPDDAHWNLDTRGDIDLLVILNPAGNVLHQCFGEVSAAEACEKLGGAYDVSANSPPDLRCNPDLNCVNHSVGVVDDPSVCQAPYQSNPMGYIDGAYKYLCTWCNRNRGTP